MRGVSATPTPVDTAPLADLLVWADTECHALAGSVAGAFAERLWRIRMALEARHRQDLDPGAAPSLVDRIASLREAEADLASLVAILRTVGGPITWREATDQPGRPAAPR